MLTANVAMLLVEIIRGVLHYIYKKYTLCVHRYK